MKSISPNLNLMIKACEKASKVLIRDFGELENLQVSKKGPKDFVTNSDKKIEKILINELSKKNFSIISEEIGTKLRNNSKNFWVIDPIDGTTNFLHGIPHFCISVAFMSDQEIISGVIYDPIKNEIFYADKGGGSYLNNKSIRVSNSKNINSCLYATNYRKNLPDNLIVRNTGSAALDLAYVSCGRFDASLQRNVNLWDIAAGIILISEAGGVLDEIQLEKFDKFNFKASNERISSELNQKFSMF